MDSSFSPWYAPNASLARPNWLFSPPPILNGIPFASRLDVTLRGRERGRGESHAEQKRRAWKMTRASVTVTGKTRPRSNKYSKHDHDRKPEPGTRQRVWVGAYERPD